ncbi:hypothetical protein EP7_005107 [Isosphaeraceae bacterium EP7]
MSEEFHEAGSNNVAQAADTLEMVRSGARQGAADARDVANRVWDGAGLFFCRFLYTTSYTLSYGVVFPATLLARSIPRENSAVHGFIDGARAAREKVDQVLETRSEHHSLIITTV